MFAVGTLASGGAGLALASGSNPASAADTVPTTTEPASTPTPTVPAPDPAPDPAPVTVKPAPKPTPKPAPRPVQHVSKPAPKPAPKPVYRPPAQTPAPTVARSTPPAVTPRVVVQPKVTHRPKVHRHVAKPKPVVKAKPVTRHVAAPPLPVVAVEQGIASSPAAHAAAPWRRMLLWTLLAASIAAFGIAVLPTVVPRGVLVVEARFPLALFGTLLLGATVGFWLVGVR
jgi:hypothetical protein